MGHPQGTPLVPQDIVEWVERLFPNECPRLTATDREVWFAAGAASVARKLRQEHEAQTTQRLEDMNQ